MQNQTSFSLTQSGQPFFIPNSLENSSSIASTYTLSGTALPTGNVTITVEGISGSQGDVQVLDSFSFSATTPQTRSVSLGSAFDYFQVTANWQSGVNVAVAGILVSLAGSGPAFDPSIDVANINVISE